MSILNSDASFDLSKVAVGITVVLWIPFRGTGLLLLVVLWTTVWCYTKQPTLWAGMSLSLSSEELWVWLFLLVVARLSKNICWIDMLIQELKPQTINLSLWLQLQRLVSVLFGLCYVSWSASCLSGYSSVKDGFMVINLIVNDKHITWYRVCNATP